MVHDWQGMVIKSSQGSPFSTTIVQLPRQCGKTWTSKVLARGFNKKEKIMNNEEAAKELEVLRNKIKDIEEGLLKADKKPWRAGTCENYLHINSLGMVNACFEYGDGVDDTRYANGNYFKDQGEACDSLIYKVINDKWHYWVAGVNEKPEAVPDGCEVFTSYGNKWETDVDDDPFFWSNSPRRWSKQ